jgi:hypothetical protein
LRNQRIAESISKGRLGICLASRLSDLLFPGPEVVRLMIILILGGWMMIKARDE